MFKNYLFEPILSFIFGCYWARSFLIPKLKFSRRYDTDIGDLFAKKNYLTVSLPIVSTSAPESPLTGCISGTKHFHELSLLPLERAWNFDKNRLVLGAVLVKPIVSHARDVGGIFFVLSAKTSGKEGVKATD